MLVAFSVAPSGGGDGSDSVHDAVAAVDGVHSESEGVEPSRRVVVLLD